MRLEVPDIYWHGPKDRILALTFSPSGDTLITAGTVDSETQRTFIRVINSFKLRKTHFSIAMGD